MLQHKEREKKEQGCLKDCQLESDQRRILYTHLWICKDSIWHWNLTMSTVLTCVILKSRCVILSSHVIHSSLPGRV